MEWIDRNRTVSIIVFICIVIGCNFIFWKIYAITEVKDMDEDIIKISTDYTNKINEESLYRIETKLDTLIKSKDGND